MLNRKQVVTALAAAMAVAAVVQFTQGQAQSAGGPDVTVVNTAANPVKTARSTVGVTALVNADWLIEIEAFAVYPAGK